MSSSVAYIGRGQMGSGRRDIKISGSTTKVLQKHLRISGESHSLEEMAVGGGGASQQSLKRIAYAQVLICTSSSNSPAAGHSSSDTSLAGAAVPSL